MKALPENAAIVVLGVSIVTFALLHVISSSPGRAVLGLRATPPAVAAFNRAHGYDDPIWVQYWHSLLQNLHGDLGYSYKLNQSVNALLAETAGRSALLTGASLVVAILVGGWGSGSAGVITILALAGAVVVTVSGSYPSQLFDVTMGLNRWCYRVLTYAALMRDDYPPFRFDGGGSDPGNPPAQDELPLAA